jgi:uncharacterized membrane protein YbhN (UPF0104 family)
VKAGLKSLIVWGGRLLLVVALVFVGLKLRSHWSDITAWRPDGSDIAAIAGLSVFYGSALYLLTEGWHRIVNLFAQEPRPRTFRSFTVTQVAKYLPGNIAHIVGRGFYLRGNALSDRQIVGATLVELALIPAAALVCIVLLGSAGQLDELVPHLPPAFWWPCALALLAAGVAAYIAVKRLFPENVVLMPGLAISTGLAVVFMGCLGLTFAALFQILASAPLAPLAGATILAWLIGFLTPGAPGGVGVREAVLIALLDNFGQEDTVLLAAALFRLVTTLGDIFLFATGWLLFRKSAPGREQA